MEDIINSSYEFPNEEDFSEEKDEDWWININNEIRFLKNIIIPNMVYPLNLCLYCHNNEYRITEKK